MSSVRRYVNLCCIWKPFKEQGHAPTGLCKLSNSIKVASDTWVILAATISVIVLSSCSTSGGVAPTAAYDNRYYVGAGALISKLEPDTDEVPESVKDSESAGFSLTAGADISESLSIEGYLSDLGSAELAPTGSVDYQVAGLSVLAYGLSSIKDRRERIGFLPFGRIGVGALQNDAESVRYEKVNDIHLLLGAGIEYGFDNGFAARAEVIAHETDARFAQLGIVYRFGRYGAQSASRIRTPTTQPQDTPIAAPTESADPLSEETEPATQQPDPIPAPPVPDTDLDGVPDASDLCPDTGSGLPVRDDGCEVFNGVIEGINFETGSDSLTPDAVAVLAGVAQTLRDYPQIKVTIESHTDNRGSALENLQLSRRRAIAVARFLVDQGISGSRLKPQAFGESTPRVSNRTEDGRTANRRVEFSVFE